MGFVRREMSIEGFFDHISWGVLFGGIFALIFMFTLIFVTETRISDRANEQNLYLALAGKEVSSEEAKETAGFVKQLLTSGFSDNLDMRHEEIVLFKRLIGNGTGSPESLNFAINHFAKVEEIINNPEEAEIVVRIPSRKYWFLVLGGLTSWFIIAMGSSIAYVWKTCDNLRMLGDEIWEYPWNKFWAYPALIVMLPYLVAVYPPSFVYLLGRRYIGGDREAISQAQRYSARRPEAGNHQREKRDVIEKTKAIREGLKENRLKWIALFSQRSIFEKRDKLKASVESERDKLTALGEEIQSKQRVLAENHAILQKLEEQIAIGTLEEDLSREFDQLMNIPHVAAVEVEGGLIHVYTDTIYIDYRFFRYEIGNFRIGIYPELSMKNLSSTYPGHDHPHGNGRICFGKITERVYEHQSKREYVYLVRLIIEALHSYDISGGPSARLANWKSVSKREGGK